MWARLHDGESHELYSEDLDTSIKDEEDETASQVTHLEDEPAAGAVSDGEASVTDERRKRAKDEVEQEVEPSSKVEDSGLEEESIEPPNKKSRFVPI
jgi:hypothetical protein